VRHSDPFHKSSLIPPAVAVAAALRSQEKSAERPSLLSKKPGTPDNCEGGPRRSVALRGSETLQCLRVVVVVDFAGFFTVVGAAVAGVVVDGGAVPISTLFGSIG
jgi:hypothetical protein